MLNVYTGKYKYKDLLFSAANRLKKATSDFIEANRTKHGIAEITGGLDSRMVLATLLSINYKEFSVYTFGKKDSFDQRYSQLVQNLFELDTISYVNDKTRIQAAKDNYMLTAGAFIPVDISYRSIYKRNNYFSFAGTGGELCRGYYFKNTFKKYIKELSNINNFSNRELFKLLVLQFSNCSLLNEDFVESLAKQCEEYYSGYKLSKELYLLLDYSFFQCRVRWHCGKQMQYRNQNYLNTISPLNDFIFHSLSFAINGYKRVSDLNVLNLLDILYPPLKYFPYQDNNPFGNLDKERITFSLPKERTSISKQSIGLPNKDNALVEEPDLSSVDHLFDRFVEEGYREFFDIEKFKNLCKNPEAKKKLVERISPLLFWDHFIK